jgi:RHS repeat-associated protein
VKVLAAIDPQGNRPPVINSTPSFLADTAKPYIYQVVASDPDAGSVLSYSLVTAPSGMAIDGVTGLITWANPVLSAQGYEVVVKVTDQYGFGVGQGYNLVVNQNRAPVIVSTSATTVAIGGTYRYDVRATDADGDALTYALNQGAIDRGVSIDNRGRIIWTPKGSDLSSPVAIAVTVTDAQGAVAVQSYSLSAIADTEAPKVSLITTTNLLNVGQSVSFEVRGTDNVGVTGLTLVVNGQSVALDGQGRATIKFDTVQTVTAVATAIDGANNSTTSAPAIVDVIDPSLGFNPLLSLDLTSLPGGVIKAPTVIRGTVGGSGFARYELQIAALDSDDFKVIGSGNGAVTNGVLGTVDPSLLINDTYRLRLVAYGVNGNAEITEEEISVEGELKLGNFRLSFTDLAIPVTGIPISLTRTYDTLTANESDDFGYGWRMEFRDTDLRTSLGKRSEAEEELGRYPAFKDNTKVYITLPGGKREAYTFKAEQVTYFEEGGQRLGTGDFASRLFRAKFEHEKGSTNELTVESGIFIRGRDGRYYGFQGQPYNPADGLFGGVYVLKSKDGTVYRIDAGTGDLLTVKDTNGNTLTYSDSEIKSSTGQKVTFERDAQGRIKSVKDPMGELLRYDYDGSGDLISVTDREQNTTRMVYDTSYDDPNYANTGGVVDQGRVKRSHYLREIIDPLGRVGARSEYDEVTGRLKQITDVNGQSVLMEYDPANSRQVVKDQLGRPTTYVYDGRGNILTEIDAVGKVTQRKYDDENNMYEEVVITAETGPDGYKTTYTYDGKGNQKTRTNAMDETDIYTYNDRSQLLTSTDALGHITKYSYDDRNNVLSKLDAAGNLTNYTYYENGLSKTIVEGANRGVQDVTYFEYDLYGNQILKRDAVGNEMSFTYDRNGNAATETHKMTTLTGVRTVTTTKTYDRSSKVRTILDAVGGLTTYDYDKNGNQTKVVNAQGQTTLMVYDDKNQLLETILDDDTPNNPNDNPRLKNEFDVIGNKTGVTDQKGRKTIYSYDALQRPTGMVLPDGTPLTSDDNTQVGVTYNTLGWMTKLVKNGVTSEFEYDKAGRITKTWVTQNGQRQETLTVYDKAGRAIEKTNALGQTMKYDYDEMGRLIETIYENNKSEKTVYNYAGKEIAKIDRAGRTTKYEYDVLDRLTAVENAKNYRMSYGYDEVGNLITQTDANIHITKYEYDSLNRRVAVIRPMNQRSETTYDAIGRVKETKDFNGAVIKYGYDKENQLISKQFVNEGDRVETYNTAVDARSRTVTDARGTTSYAYDEQGRMLSKTEPDGKQISYTYDLVSGKVASVTTPSGTTQYRYNALNQLSKVISAEGETMYSYNAIGNPKTKTLPNGIVESYGYDNLNRLELLEQKNAAGTVLARYAYIYDLVGNKTKVEELGGRSVSYTYDELYRLTKEAIVDPLHGNRTIEYVYDAVGNRLLKKDTAVGDIIYRYNQNDWLLDEAIGGAVKTAYTYDNNGNTKTKIVGTELTTYVWDTQNRLTAATISEGSQTKQLGYEYNVNGVRTKSMVDGAETRYLLDENRQYAQVMEEYNGTGLQSRYVYGGELDLISQTHGASKLYYLEDRHSGIRQLTNVNGAVVNQYGYDSYGNLVYSVDNEPNSYQYRGEQSDKSLDIQYLRARYYDTHIGRFISVDPFEGYQNSPISKHRYLYSNDNPISNFDPSGETTIVDQIASLQIIRILAFSQLAIVAQASLGRILSKTAGDIKWEGKYYSLEATPSLESAEIKFGGSLLDLTTVNKEVSANWPGITAQFRGLWLQVYAGAGIVSHDYKSMEPGSVTIGAETEAFSPRVFQASASAFAGAFISTVVKAPGKKTTKYFAGFGIGLVDKERTASSDAGISISEGLSIPLSIFPKDKFLPLQDLFRLGSGS